MCKANGLNHKALDVRTPCVCIRKASFMETNMPTLGAEMPKNAVGKHSSVMRNGAFGTMEKPFPHGDKASSARRSGEDDARRRCYGVPDVAVSLYFVIVKIKSSFYSSLSSRPPCHGVPSLSCHAAYCHARAALHRLTPLSMRLSAGSFG